MAAASQNPFDPTSNPFTTGLAGSVTPNSAANASAQTPAVKPGKTSGWDSFGASADAWHAINVTAKQAALQSLAMGGPDQREPGSGLGGNQPVVTPNPNDPFVTPANPTVLHPANTDPAMPTTPVDPGYNAPFSPHPANPNPASPNPVDPGYNAPFGPHSSDPAITPVTTTPTEPDVRGVNADAIEEYQRQRWIRENPGVTPPWAVQPPVVPPVTPVVTPPHVDPAGPTTPTTPGAPDNGQPKDLTPELYSYLQRLTAAPNQQAQNDLGRQMRAAMANSGAINSGGAVPEIGQQEARLIGEQSGKMSDLLANLSDSEKNRLNQLKLAQMGIDANKVLAEMQDATTRYGIDTTDKLQRYLNSQDNALKKYGIDAQMVMAKIQAETGLSAAQIQAGATVTAEQIRAATEAAINQANLQQSNTNSQRQYDLGVLGLNEDVYKSDQQSYQWYLQMLAEQSPEQRANLGAIGQLPGYVTTSGG